MGAWRYCHECGQGQSQITVDEIAEVAYDEHVRVRCACGVERTDDTDGQRIIILIEELIKLRDSVNSR